MAKAEFLRTIKKNIPFVNLSTTFIFLAIIFLISIISFFIFNKHIVENLAAMPDIKKQTKPDTFDMQKPITEMMSIKKPKTEPFKLNPKIKQQ
jgi:hypothetical protein